MVAFLHSMEEVKVCAGETEVLDVEQTPLFYSRKHDNYLLNSRLKRLRHSNIVKQANHFRRKGLSLNSIVVWMCYDAPDNIKLA